MAIPRCPYANCGVGRDPHSLMRTAPVTSEQLRRFGVTAEAPVYRCGYCQQIWGEPEHDEIVPLGLLHLAQERFTPFERPSTVELVEGKRHAQRAVAT